MNLISTLLSKIFNQSTDKQARIDIKQGQLKVLADRLKKKGILTPKVITGGVMIAGLWWITKRREKVKETEQDKSIN